MGPKLEDRVKEEWGAVRSFVALHPYVTVFTIAVVANLAGVFLGY